MFRNTVPGLALANALAHFESAEAFAGADVAGDHGDASTVPLRLTQAQRDEVWRAFDAAMDEALMEAPAALTAVVKTAPPPPLTVSSPAVLAATESDDGVGVATAVALAPASGAASSLPVLPLARCVDGRWTIVLPNATVTVRNADATPAPGVSHSSGAGVVPVGVAPPPEASETFHVGLLTIEGYEPRGGGVRKRKRQ